MKQIAFSVLSLLIFTACGREESSTYQVPKELKTPAPASSMGTQGDVEAVQAAHAMMTAQAPVETGFSSELPDGWTEVPGSGMRKVSYTIEGTSIDFYLISLSMGDVPSNVNRWRGQVGLSSATPEGIAKDLSTYEVDGHAVKSRRPVSAKPGSRQVGEAPTETIAKNRYLTAALIHRPHMGDGVAEILDALLDVGERDAVDVASLARPITLAGLATAYQRLKG